MAARRSERNLLMLIKDQEGGPRGKPYQGVSPLLFCPETFPFLFTYHSRKVHVKSVKIND